MAWIYTIGVLTSTGATETSPDSISSGIAIVQASDSTRGYVNGSLAWLQNVEVRLTNSVVLIDPDLQVEFRTGAFINPSNAGTNGGLILGQRSTQILTGNTNFGSLPNAGLFITRKDKPNDPSARIIYKNTVRIDYPTVSTSTFVLNKAEINGLDLYASSLSTANFFRLFFANALISSIKDIRVFDSSTGETGIFPNGLNVFLFSGTYDNLYREKNDFGTEFGVINTVNLNKPFFYGLSPTPLIGYIRSSTFNLINPSFLNNSWDGTANFNSFQITVDSKFNLIYTYTNKFREGLNNLQGVSARFTRARASVIGSPTWVVSNSIVTATSDINGTYSIVNLIDTYREGVSLTDLERFIWTLKARKYDKKTPGETVFLNRVLYQSSTNMSLGYNEEVQMLQVNHLTLTEIQANALIGISFSPIGVNGGVVALTANTTISELWQYYRSWICKTANFNNEDTWNYDGNNLNIGAWTIIGLQFLSNGNITTTSANANASFNNIQVTGNVNQNTPTNITNINVSTLAYNTNTDITVTFTNCILGTVTNAGTGIVTIVNINSTIADYSDAQINFLDSTLLFAGISELKLYPTAIDRDNNTNLAITINSSPFNFKFGSIINGVTMSGTVYMRSLIGSAIQLQDKTLVFGSNTIDLTDNALLQSLSSNIKTVNNNVIKSSKFKTATEIF